MIRINNDVKKCITMDILRTIRNDKIFQHKNITRKRLLVFLFKSIFKHVPVKLYLVINFIRGFQINNVHKNVK